MTPRQHAISVLKFTRDVGTLTLKGFAEDRYTWQTSPFDNHPMWVLGHLATTDAWILGAVGGKGADLPAGWEKHFGPGTKPVSDPKQYPPLAEIRRVFETTRAALLNWLEGAKESDLSIPLKEKTRGFALDPIDAALKVAWHEGWHFGQVATLRKAQGLPAVMGA
jgi:DinB superfamily